MTQSDQEREINEEKCTGVRDMWDYKKSTSISVIRILEEKGKRK